MELLHKFEDSASPWCIGCCGILLLGFGSGWGGNWFGFHGNGRESYGFWFWTRICGNWLAWGIWLDGGRNCGGI